MRRKRSGRHGFTLLELLLVLGILVILASFVAVNFTGVMGDSDRKAAKAQIGMLEGAVKLYQFHMKQYPSTSSGLQALVSPPSDVANPSKWQGPYLEKGVPLDPWERPYQYSAPGRRNPNTFDIWSLGADGVDGTDDDIGNWQ